MSFTNNLGKDLIDFNSNKWSNDINDYVMLGLIGKGSFGQVFKAIDKSVGDLSQNKYCAVKWIAKKCSPNIGKILTEVSIHLRLKNDNILQLFNVIEDNSYVYLVVELCCGGTLAQLIQQTAKQNKTLKQNNDSKALRKSYLLPVLDYCLVRNIMKQLCNGLDYLHRNAIVHRDLNHNNVLIMHPFERSDDLIVKIADFGLAIDLNSCSLQNISSKPHREEHVIPLPMGTTICGTPGFISPEVWSQMQTVSPKSDIFSLGSILFSCVAGYTPKGGLDLSKFSPLVSDLITRLLAPNPTDRPTIDDILNHPFIVGPLTTERLLPINKTTKVLKLSIDSEGNVCLVFRKSETALEVSGNGLNVRIYGPQREDSKYYTFYDLPPNQWKKYFYAQKFVELVRGKTPKITVNSPKDDNNTSEHIIKCCLMENNDFEVTIFNPINNEVNKVLVNNYNQLKDKKFVKRVEELHEFCLKKEKELKTTQYKTGINCFPVSFGRKNKSKTDSLQTVSTHQPFISSQTLRSIQIDGIGQASQLSNGVFSVCFTDGSTLAFKTDSEYPVVFNPRNGREMRYKKSDILPDFVKQKLAFLPQIVDRLRDCQTSR